MRVLRVRVVEVELAKAASTLVYPCADDLDVKFKSKKLRMTPRFLLREQKDTKAPFQLRKPQGTGA